ncbi:putative ankyrin repeat protein [Tolypocladium ophioglossoides CBS 100239]|uniref:Putative ankyrin repeat protein n=1 Tax=Tolypocladium ophioglossoides (strain CBS 100239) TaxID=1163406 RepID=A0A0L0NGP1_TOLOC|nr:putative ankyrin repeat protein [Tolypocladium ophioglossoides CBS 100239]
MATIGHLPAEIILFVGEATNSSRSIAALARTGRRFYNALNVLLYKFNATRDHPAKSCLLWAAKSGCLETIKLGHRYGADLNVDGTTDDDWDFVEDSIEGTAIPFATPLQIAAHYDHFDIVQYLLESDVIIHAESRNLCDCGGGKVRFPLHEAFYHCTNDDMAALLIEHGSYLEGLGSPALHVAATLNKVHLFRALLEVPEVQADARNEVEDTALHYAAKMGNLEIVRLLLARPEVDAGAAGELLCTPLHYAALNCRLGAIKLLLDRPEVDIDAGTESGDTAIDYAFRSKTMCSVKLIETLLHRPGVDAAVKRSRCHKAVCLAAQRSRVDIIRTLLHRTEVGAGDKTPIGNTALHAAAQSENVHVVEFLLRQPGVDVNASGNGGETPLHWAMDGPKDVIQTLIDAGADIHKPGALGTPLRYAVLYCNNSAIKMLLSHGADPSVPKSGLDDGLTLLHHCFRPGWEPEETKPDRKIVLNLVKGGADLDTMSTMATAASPPEPLEKWRNEGTPLFFATAYMEETFFMEILLDAGARADSVVVDRMAAEGSPQSFLAGLFRHEFGVYPYHARAADDEISDEMVRRVRGRVRSLLKYGARLDNVNGEQSALEYACEVAYKSALRHELLWLLLWNSTSRNVSLEHVERVVLLYDLKENTDDAQAENCCKILARLSRFIERVF